MIRNIQNFFFTLPTGGTLITFSTAINPTKALVFLFGAKHQEQMFYGPFNPAGYAYNIFPAYRDMDSTQVSIIWSSYSPYSAKVSAQIIEYI